MSATNTSCLVCGAPAWRNRLLVPVSMISPPPRQAETHVEFSVVTCSRYESHRERLERPVDVTEIGDDACPVM